MFHGITNRGQGWLRVLTATPLLEDEQVLEQFDGGPYWPAFLETFFPGKYRVEVRKVSKKYIGETRSNSPKADLNLSPNEVIRWSNATDQYSILIDDAPLNDGGDTWLEAFDQIGLIVGNSKKMSKRLTELVRLSSGWHYSPNGKIKIETIDYLNLGYLDEHVDGISAISQTFAIQCIAANHLATGEWTNQQISRIVNGQMTVVQIRVLTAAGLIKGNALVLPDKMMKGYDIRTFEPNVKSEIRTLGWQFATIEPSYSTIPVKSDDLTHAIYQTVNGMYTHRDLLESLNHSLQDEYNKLQSGERTTAMTALVDNAHTIFRSDSTDEEDRFRTTRSNLQIVQETIRDLSTLGIPFEATQHLRFLTVNGIATQYLGVEHNGKVGQIWRNKSKHWMPVPWSYTTHIITQEVLEIFGFNKVYRDGGYYHSKTHCFVVPGKFFIENMINHGGYDQDDSIKVHVRLVRMPDTSIQLMAILLRNPNDFGEWSMIPIKGYGPVFHRYSALPPVVDYNELCSFVPQASTLIDQKLVVPGKLPGLKSLKIGPRFSLVDEGRNRLVALAFPGGVGSSVLPKMMHYGLNNTYLANPVATNEEIIDALQQGLATAVDVSLIKKWSEKIFADILDNHGKNGTKMDIFWMASRLPKRYAEGIDSTTVEESPWCQAHIEREFDVRTTFALMCEYLNSSMVEPDIIMDINFTEDELYQARDLHLKLSTKQKIMQSHEWVSYMVDLFTRTDENEEKGIEYTNRIVLMLAHQSYLAKRQYPRQSHDQWLYTFSDKSDRQIVDWYIRAIKSIKPEEEQD
jgi:hypothetical protein